MTQTLQPDLDKKRAALITTAGWIALIGNLALALFKIIAGSVSGSLAVLGDGIDSSTDVAIALMTLIVGRIISRPSDTEHPWGHGRAETTATLVLSFIIFFAGAQLGYSAAGRLISGETTELPGMLAIIATAVSVVGKSLLAFSQYALGKKARSPMIQANAQNMRNDIVISLSVLVGLGAARIFKLPVIDSITALAVSVWVMKNAVGIFLDMNRELMDGTQNKEIYAQLFEAVHAVEGTSNPHRARIRKIASRWDIDIDIEVDERLTVHEAHRIAERVEMSVKNTIPDVYDIMVHVEPAGHNLHHPAEQFGLSEADVQKTE